MTYTPALIVASAGQRDFTVPFPYLNKTHVEVLVNGITTSVLEWPSSVTVRLAAPLAGGESVVIRRTTPIDTGLVTFTNGAVLTEEDLNLAVKQLLFKQQEVTYLYENSLLAAQTRIAENLGLVVSPEDVANQLAAAVLQEQVLATFQQGLADIDANAGSILQQAFDLTAVENDLATLTDVVDALAGGDPGTGLATLIADEETARIAGDTALAGTVALIGAKSGDNLSFIIDTNTAKVSSTESLAQRLSSIAAADADNAAAIVTEANARVAADNAEAAARIALASRVTTAEAAIVTEQTTRASQDSALSSSITALTTTVNGNTASVASLASSVNGLEALYGVQLNVNGYVTGFLQNNNGSTGSFTILADKFSIIDPANNGQGSPLIPFEVSGGVVRIKEAAIGTLSVGRLTQGTLTASVTQNADWNVGTGRIIWDNGAYMKVSGVGFGTSSQFIEWFGPKMAINLCSEANGIQYLKTNGDAYFGGSLSAGTLKNAAQTTSTLSDASVTVGPFGTNGNPINVVTSYGIQSQFTNYYENSLAGRNEWDAAVASWGATVYTDQEAPYVNESKSVSCNITVAITKNGTSFATLTITSGTEHISGYRYIEPGSQPYLTYTRSVSGSITSTDSAGGTTQRTFTATITNRSGAVTGNIAFQNLGIIATEE